MFDGRTRVLLVLPQDVFDRARALAGKATTALKLPVSGQIVLRALIEEGLRRGDDPSLLANIQSQAQAIRRIRSLAGRAGGDRGAVTGPVTTRRAPGARKAPRRPR